MSGRLASPWRGEKNDDEIIAGVPPRSHKGLVIAVDEFDRGVKVLDIPSCQIEDGGLGLKTDALGAQQMAENRVETIARACERIDDSDRAVADSWQYDLGDVPSDLVSEGVFDRLQTGARQYADTPLVPRFWRQPVEVDVVWVVKAIASVLLNLPQFDDLIAFYGAEQKVTVVLPVFILCCHACT